MGWVHMGMVFRAEAEADGFFCSLLGLEKTEPKTLPAEVSKGIFGVDQDLPMIYYNGLDLQFEVFIDPHYQPSNDRIVHACISVPDIDAFLAKCENADVEIIRVPKGDRVLVFIRDAAGHLYEIKS